MSPHLVQNFMPGETTGFGVRIMGSPMKAENSAICKLQEELFRLPQGDAGQHTEHFFADGLH